MFNEVMVDEYIFCTPQPERALQPYEIIPCERNGMVGKHIICTAGILGASQWARSPIRGKSQELREAGL